MLSSHLITVSNLCQHFVVIKSQTCYNEQIYQNKMFFWPAVIFGFTQGFVVGPITLYGIREGLNPRKGIWLQMQVIFGACLVDTAYLLLGTYGVINFINHDWVRALMWLAASYLLTSMGIHSLRDHTHKGSFQHMHRHKLHFFDSEFFKGIMMCLVNPMAMVFSIVVVGSLYGNYSSEVSPLNFAMSVNAGGIMTSFLIIGATFLIRQVFHPWMLKRLMQAGSYILVGYGVWFSFKAVMEIQPMVLGLIS